MYANQYPKLTDFVFYREIDLFNNAHSTLKPRYRQSIYKSREKGKVSTYKKKCGIVHM